MASGSRGFTTSSSKSKPSLSQGECHIVLGNSHRTRLGSSRPPGPPHHPSSTTPHASLAALILLSSSLPQTQTQFQTTGPSSVEPPNISPHLLSDSIPVLTAALSSSAVDAALTWLWYLIQSDQVYVTHDQATLLLEVDQYS